MGGNWKGCWLEMREEGEEGEGGHGMRGMGWDSLRRAADMYRMMWCEASDVCEYSEILAPSTSPLPCHHATILLR